MLKKLRLGHLGVHFDQRENTGASQADRLRGLLPPELKSRPRVPLHLPRRAHTWLLKIWWAWKMIFSFDSFGWFRFFCVLWLHEDLPSTRWYINHVTLNYFFLLCQQKYVNLGQLFHFEFMISRLTKSFDIFITASWWVLHSGECEMDYVQFGRDILFITSHRSNK